MNNLNIDNIVCFVEFPAVYYKKIIYLCKNENKKKN